MRLKGFAEKIFFLEILKGLFLTLKVFFKRPVTIKYPHEKREIKDGFRGRHAFIRDKETGKERCVACMKCAMVCPSQCISVKYSSGNNNERVLERYEIEALRCIYCGYCVEVCPMNAIVLTEHYEYCNYKRADFSFDREKLLMNWDEFIKTRHGDVYFNKFWCPPGIDISRLPVGKRQVKEGG